MVDDTKELSPGLALSKSWRQKRKIPMIADPDTREDPPNHNLETTREAQRVVGELVWVATRTRPDLAFAITKLASLITKDPQLVIDLTKNVWHYLANTMDHGLQFQNQLEDRQLNSTSTAMPHLAKSAWAAIWSCGDRPCSYGRQADSQWPQLRPQKQSWWRFWRVLWLVTPFESSWRRH